MTEKKNTSSVYEDYYKLIFLLKETGYKKLFFDNLDEEKLLCSFET